MRRYLVPIIIAIAAILVIFGGTIIMMYTDWLWFKDLGFGGIFSRILMAKVELGLVAGLMFFAIIYSNLWYARRIAPPASPMGMEQQLLERLGRLARRGIGLVLLGASVVVSVMVGLEAATHWETWLRFANSVPFGVKDQVFNKDIGFYVFKLPFLSYVYYWLFFALAAATIASIGLHYADEAVDVFGNKVQFSPKVKGHIFTLIAVMFFLKAWGYMLSKYSLVSAQGGLFDGAGYTDIHTRIPAYNILIVIAVIAGLLVLVNIARRGIGYLAVGFGGLVACSLLVGAIYPEIVQAYSVRPNELQKESPYIKRAIVATKEAYGLTGVSSQPFAAEKTLTASQIAANSATIENIRLWDQDHLQAAYNQVQTIQQYYHFQDVDVDRYWLTNPATGQKSYRQVWLSARELAQDQLPEKSRTWINQHLQYTHGYGFSMSPVNEISSEGLPNYFVYDIPPKTTVDIPIKQMGVYAGERTDNYVFTKTSAPEFDYPSGNGEKAATYNTNGGIRLGGLFRKLIFAARFSDLNILLNQNLKSNSRILFRRDIWDRTELLMPFLQFDDDPYLVTTNGKLYWMRDAYTTTDAYPYAKHSENSAIGFNYIRNSVKLVVDAYTGKVDAYVIQEPVKDPIIECYRKAFPGAFKPISQMPKALRDHIRYPEYLFKVQTRVYTRYHYSKNDTDGFYRNGDLWEIPNRASLTGNDQADTDPMKPYYIIMRLPNGKSEEFILMTPYVRAGARRNMVAWICAKCDAPDYGRIVLYEFPENKNVYGPQQVAGLASQDTQISQQLSLLNQHGSTVGSGNLIVIPIESSLLYVMPVYLVSTSTQIPELKRVIVALGDKIAMEPTLDQALSEVVGQPVAMPENVSAASGSGELVSPKSKSKAVPASIGVHSGQLSPQTRQLVDKAVTQMQKAEDAQKNGDWATYGQQIQALKKTLNELQGQAK